MSTHIGQRREPVNPAPAKPVEPVQAEAPAEPKPKRVTKRSKTAKAK